MPIREQLWVLFDEPSSNRLAYSISVFIMGLIVLSVVTFILESLPQFYAKGGHVVFDMIEIVCIAVFTLEFAIRLGTCPRLADFVRGPLNIVDLVAIVPFYVELLAGSSSVGSSAVLRVVRLVRVFRVFKLTRYLSWVRTFTSAMAKSAQPLGMLLFVMLIGVIVFSSAIYYAERGTLDPASGRMLRKDGRPSPYSSIVQSSWWAIITMTTVGYGDDVPVTTAGKLIAAVTSLTGVLVLAIPITVISTNFSEEYNKLRKQKQRVRARITMLRNQFKQQRSGLDAIWDELEEMVRRNNAELKKETEDLFDTAALELREELKAITQLAFRQRKKKLVEQANMEVRERVQGGAGDGGPGGGGQVDGGIGAFGVQVGSSRGGASGGLGAPIGAADSKGSEGGRDGDQEQEQEVLPAGPVRTVRRGERAGDGAFESSKGPRRMGVAGIGRASQLAALEAAGAPDSGKPHHSTGTGPLDTGGRPEGPALIEASMHGHGQTSSGSPAPTAASTTEASSGSPLQGPSASAGSGGSSGAPSRGGNGGRAGGVTVLAASRPAAVRPPPDSAQERGDRAGHGGQKGDS